MTTIGEWWMWAAFFAFVVVAVVVDLVVLRAQGAHKVSVREAAIWSLVWVGLAVVFCAGLWWYLDNNFGREVANEKSMEFFTGYLIEKSLAVDNIFVFLMIFTYFAVPLEFQKRVIIIGVIGAIVLRAIMILLGAVLIAKFHWILYLFGLFLLVTGMKMLWFADEAPDLEQNPILRWMRGHPPLDREFTGERFTVVLLALAMVLIFVGMKMLLVEWFKVPAFVSLGIVVGILTTSIVISMMSPPKVMAPAPDAEKPRDPQSPVDTQA